MYLVLKLSCFMYRYILTPWETVRHAATAEDMTDYKLAKITFDLYVGQYFRPLINRQVFTGDRMAN